MKLPDLPFTAVDWPQVPALEVPGERGISHWRNFEVPGLRVRVVDYGAGFVADHWCDRGHVLYVLKGALVVELRDGRAVPLGTGAGFQVSDHGDAAHRVRSKMGARVFIVD